MITVYHVCRALGTQFELVLYGATEIQVRAIGEAAMEEIHRLDSELNPTQPASQIRLINERAHEGPVRVSPGVFELLQRARRLWEQTGGAFDVTIGAWIELWVGAGVAGRVPSEQELESARQRAGWDQVVLDPAEHSISFKRSGVRLDVTGLVKGYALDRVAELLRESGVKSALIHAGSSTVFCVGKSPAGTPWRVGIRAPGAQSQSGFDENPVLAYLPPRHMHDVDNPRWQFNQAFVTTLELADAALSVSGPFLRVLGSGEAPCAHILNPETGRPVSGPYLALAVAASATNADAASTALVVMGFDRARGILNSGLITEAYVIERVTGASGMELKLLRLG